MERLYNNEYDHYHMDIYADADGVMFNVGDKLETIAHYVVRDEALATAKAILGHYGVAYQVGEEVW